MHPPTLPLPLAWAITVAGAVIMVGGVTLLRAKGWTTPLQGRKLMHLATGPVYLLCWLLFPLDTPLSPLLASLVPLSVALFMLCNARGWCGVSNRYLIQTVSRSGARQELSEGPMWYGLIHSLAALLFWTRSPTGLVSLLVLCVGDGVADLVGRPWGTHKWRFNRDKSIQGSAAFVVATLVVLFLYVDLFVSMGFFKQSSFHWQLPVLTVFAALVESLPLGSYDNLAVFVSVVIVGWCFGW